MKNIFFLLLTLTISAACFSQTDTVKNTTGEPQKMQTLFGSPGKLGWWVSPDFEWTQFDKKDAFLVGLSGGIIVKHSFSIGLAGYGIVNSQNLKFSGKNDTANVYLYGGYGGLKLEYRIFPLNMVNLGFPVLIGGGGAAYSTWNYSDWHHNPQDNSQVYTWDGFFVIEPGVVVGLNLLKFMRFDLGATYRYAPGVELPRTDSNLLCGFNVHSSLKFGSF